MKKIKLLLIFTGVLIAVIFIYFAAMRKSGPSAKGPAAPGSSQEIDYYTCGMHPSVKVTVEQYNKGKVNCPICNMKLIPVYKERAATAAPGEKKILFYRNPMNPAITSKVPAKDEMGMDYIPVYQSEEETGSYYGCGMEGEEHVFFIKDQSLKNCPICGMPLKRLSKEEADRLRGVVSRVKIQGEQARLAGVKTEAVGKGRLYKEIRTVGKVAYDPQLAIAEEELISGLKAYDKIKEGNIEEIKERALNLVESAKRKLMLLGLSRAQIGELEKTRQPHASLVMPEKRMWIYGQAYEYELGWVKAGEKVKVTVSSLPGYEFEGVIASVNPVLDPKTRSVTFRVEAANTDLELKPEMYVDVYIMSAYTGPDGRQEVLFIPKNAVLDTGIRKIVWLDMGGGEYEGREITVGPEAIVEEDGVKMSVYPVLKGLREGELVVTKANFLIDSQSQITGVAASAYGGALNSEEKKAAMPVNQHKQHRP